MADVVPSMIQVHADALAAVDEAYHDFLLVYQGGAKSVYGFVEGKDDPSFYRGLIERELPEGWSLRFIPAGSRHKVLDTMTSMDWRRFDQKRICFFVDKDLHGFLGTLTPSHPNLYVTDGYSIENSILSDSLLLGVLADLYQVSGLTPSEEAIILAQYRSGEQAFFSAMQPLMAQILVWRQFKNKANLNNLKLGEVFQFSGANLVPPTHTKLLSTASSQVGCSLAAATDLSAALLAIKSAPDQRMVIRGKYLFWFFVRQLEAIWASVPSLVPRFTSVPKKRIDFGQSSAMVVLGPRARIPTSLKRFISRTYSAYIKRVGAQAT